MKIGILDSGIGGLTTLSAIIKLLPNLEYIYFADNKNAFYGDKSEEELMSAVFNALEELKKQNIDIAVIACNTATSICADAARQYFPFPIIGTEPAVKQAAEAGGKTLVLVTPKTAKSERLKKLTERFENSEICSMDNLASIVENNIDKLENIDEFLYEKLSNRNFDNIVLGCTHYCYLNKTMERLFPNKRIFDGNGGVARRVLDIVRNINPSVIQNEPKNINLNSVRFCFSGVELCKEYRLLLYSLFK